jgi:hypothetical protein
MNGNQTFILDSHRPFICSVSLGHYCLTGAITASLWQPTLNYGQHCLSCGHYYLDAATIVSMRPSLPRLRPPLHECGHHCGIHCPHCSHPYMNSATAPHCTTMRHYCLTDHITAVLWACGHRLAVWGRHCLNVVTIASLRPPLLQGGHHSTASMTPHCIIAAIPG